MKNTIKGFILGVIVCGITVGSVALATNAEFRTLTAEFCNISIDIDQSQFIPQDVTGKEVEPFIVDGTTYLPIRAIAAAFDKEVVWDDDVKRVRIYTKSEQVFDEEVERAFENVYLDDSSLNEYKINSVENVDINTWVVNFDVLPNLGHQTNWMAGNGVMGGDWVRGKSLFVYTVKTEGVLHLRVIGTGL